VPLAGLQALVGEHFGPIPAGSAPAFWLPEVTPDPEPSYHVVTDEGQGFTYISLDDAPQGYKDFDKGAARKFVIDPHAQIAA